MPELAVMSSNHGVDSECRGVCPSSLPAGSVASALKIKDRRLICEDTQIRFSQTRIYLPQQTVDLQIENDVRRIISRGGFFGISPRLLIVFHPQIELGTFIPHRPHLRHKI